VTNTGKPGTLADLATLTHCNAATQHGWIIKISVWLLKKRKINDVQ
jgi:hypothetical protein